MDITEQLMEFGLSRPEAHIYQTLIAHGELTGYEAAKLTGFSRSNTYTSLAGLVEKGAAYVLEEQVMKYTPVSFPEFSGNYIQKLKRFQENINTRLPVRSQAPEGFITIRGTRQVLDKLRNLLKEAKHRVYLSSPGAVLSLVEELLKELSKQGKRIVILTDMPYELEGAEVYTLPMPPTQLRLITDSSIVLTGELCLTGEESSTCLYSLNRNLVDVFKEMLKNEIKLLNLEKGSV